jgi:hypothetical protein
LAGAATWLASAARVTAAPRAPRLAWNSLKPSAMRMVWRLSLTFSLLGLAGCQANDCSQGLVPIAPPLALEVVTSPARQIDGVQATLTGPVSETMSCQAFAGGSTCAWSNGAPPLTGGTYSLQVSAPGYRVTTLQATVSVESSCGQTASSISPNIVGLDPASDAGVD